MVKTKYIQGKILKTLSKMSKAGTKDVKDAYIDATLHGSTPCTIHYCSIAVKVIGDGVRERDRTAADAPTITCDPRHDSGRRGWGREQRAGAAPREMIPASAA